ncbi:MAG: DEAD/DEAH box helicase [Verrucomicrobia bacterium]|nr:DEAD/DEAH box helicase [Verrucomicrobiota bacterium]
MKAVADKGYTRPTPIQVDAIPVLMAGKDIVGGSQTGTGKTAAFALPILGLLGEHKKDRPRALILEPTRELAQQVIEQLTVYGKYTGLKSVLLHGGVGYGKQNDALKSGVDIVVATPGRLLDHLQQRTFSLKGLQVLVLDEADRMLDMGFMPDVKTHLAHVPGQTTKHAVFSHHPAGDRKARPDHAQGSCPDTHRWGDVSLQAQSNTTFTLWMTGRNSTC